MHVRARISIHSRLPSCRAICLAAIVAFLSITIDSALHAQQIIEEQVTEPDEPGELAVCGVKADGKFIIGWQAIDSENARSDIRVQRYYADGQLLGSPAYLSRVGRVLPAVS